MQRHITALPHLRSCQGRHRPGGCQKVLCASCMGSAEMQCCLASSSDTPLHCCTAAGQKQCKGYQSSSAATAGWAQQAEEATQLHSLTSAGGRRLLVALQEYDRWLFLRVQDACHTEASTPAEACPAVGKKLKHAMALQFRLRHGELQLASHAGSSSTAARRRCHERHAITAQGCSSVSEQHQPRFSMRRSRFPVERCQRPT